MPLEPRVPPRPLLIPCTVQWWSTLRIVLPRLKNEKNPTGNPTSAEFFNEVHSDNDWGHNGSNSTGIAGRVGGVGACLKTNNKQKEWGGRVSPGQKRKKLQKIPFLTIRLVGELFVLVEPLQFFGRKRTNVLCLVVQIEPLPTIKLIHFLRNLWIVLPSVILVDHKPCDLKDLEDSQLSCPSPLLKSAYHRRCCSSCVA
jgi:hypothetical protein